MPARDPAARSGAATRRPRPSRRSRSVRHPHRGRAAPPPRRRRARWIGTTAAPQARASARASAMASGGPSSASSPSSISTCEPARHRQRAVARRMGAAGHRPDRGEAQPGVRRQHLGIVGAVIGGDDHLDHRPRRAVEHRGDGDGHRRAQPMRGDQDGQSGAGSFRHLCQDGGKLARPQATQFHPQTHPQSKGFDCD